MTGEERVYPLPDEDDDPRFVFGFIDDVASVFEQHGFPRPSGWDLLELRQTLFRFLYAPESAE